MEPIISPVWIYLINLAGTINFLSICIWTASLFILVCVFTGKIEFDGSDSEKSRRRCLKIFAIIMLVCFILLVLVPNKETMYAMLAASIITPDNISVSEEHLIDLTTKIANIIYNAPK